MQEGTDSIPGRGIFSHDSNTSKYQFSLALTMKGLKSGSASDASKETQPKSRADNYRFHFLSQWVCALVSSPTPFAFLG